MHRVVIVLSSPWPAKCPFNTRSRSMAMFLGQCDPLCSGSMCVQARKWNFAQIISRGADSAVRHVTD